MPSSHRALAAVSLLFARVDGSDLLEEESVHPNEVFVHMSLEGDTATVLP
ncbi:hypothetical protein [Pyxidicoccus sp. MSG2]|nr:hypothetical protein [Pyxidicoccus sp. MSG2]MCY1018066.1 hypothetical protein [Pyxidicoccus sp. MSG2]